MYSIQRMWHQAGYYDKSRDLIEQALDEAVLDAKIEAYNDLKYTDAALERLSAKSLQIGRKEGLEMAAGIAEPMSLYTGPDIADAIRAEARGIQ